MRMISLQDLLSASLFIACTVLAYVYLRKSLFIYLAANTLLFLMSHGPYALGLWSVSRYVLVLCPAFMVMGNLLNRHRRLKWVICSFSGALLFFLSVWLGSGRWVA